MKKIITALLVFISAFNVNAQLPFTQSTLITGLSQPVAFNFAPDDYRIFITIKSGQIRTYHLDGTSIGTFYNLADSTVTTGEQGVIGICFDPEYNTNRYVYVYYNHRYPNNSSGNQAIRIIRFTDNNNTGTNPTIIMNIPVSNTIPGNHVAGNIRFRPSDGKLYIAIGELGTPSNATVTTNPFGKILRINKDGSIPADNPFHDDGNPATGNDDRIWEYGHRNPFDFTFGPNDSLYISENGASVRDECNLGTRGGNYGWYFCEGDKQTNSNTPCNNPAFINPLTVFEPIPAVTGIIFYNACMFPEYKNHLLIGSNKKGELFDCTLGNAPAYNTVTTNSLIADITPIGGLTTLMVGPEGAIYALNGGYTANGSILKLSRSITTPSVSAGGPTTFCRPGNVLLTASPSAVPYQWYKDNVVITGATSNTYLASANGSYSVKTCDLFSNNIKVRVKPRPEATVTPDGIQTVCSGSFILLKANTGAGLTYQWTRYNNHIAGATNSTYRARRPGRTRVIVTGINGCTKTSPATTIQVLSCAREENITNDEVTVFPNPSSATFTLIPDRELFYQIRVTDLQGRVMNEINEIHGTIVLGREWSAGIYLAKIISSEGSVTVKKLVKTE